MTPAEYKKRRERLGTQEEVAKRLGISANTLARRERDELPINREAELAIRWLESEARASRTKARWIGQKEERP